MNADLRSIFSYELEDLVEIQPDDPFNFYVSLSFTVGVVGQEPEDVFVVHVCTPRALESLISEGRARWGRSMLLVEQFHLANVRLMIEKVVASATGDSWQEIAEKIARFASWEYENCRPYRAT